MITISIAVMDQKEVTESFLKSVYEFTESEFEIIITDNDSGSDTVAYLNKIRRERDNITVIRNNKNVGFGPAHNEAARRARGEYFVVANNDIEVFEPWDKRMIEALESDPEVRQVGPSTGVCNKLTPEAGGVFDPTRCDDPDYIEASFMMMRLEHALEYGPFDEENYKMAYFEDSVAGNRFTVVDDGKYIRVMSFDALFSEASEVMTRPDGKEIGIFNSPRYTLKAVKTNCDELGYVPEFIKKSWSPLVQTVNELKESGLSRREMCECINKSFEGYARPDYCGNLSRESIGYIINRLYKYKKKEFTIGIWVPFTKMIRHKTNKELVRVRQKYGESVVTKDHSLITSEYNTVTPDSIKDDTWLSIDLIENRYEHNDIRITDWIHSDDKVLVSEDFISIKNAKYSNKDPMNFPVVFSGDRLMALTRLFGWYVSEGSSSDMYTCVWCGQDESIIQKVMSNFQLCFEDTCCVVKSGNPTMYSVRSGRLIIGKLFSELGGKGSDKKKVPDFIFSLSSKFRNEFLNTYVSEDGWSSKEKPVKNSSPIHDTYKAMTKSLHLISGLSVLQSMKGGYYRINRRFKDTGSYLTISTSMKYFNKTNKTFIEIPEVQPEYVYDLEVPDGGMFPDACGLVMLHNSDLSLRIRRDGFKLKTVPLKWVHYRAKTSSAVMKKIDIAGIHFCNEQAFKKNWNSYLLERRFGPVIVIQRKASYGDVFLLTPVIDALKSKYPNSVICIATQCPDMIYKNPQVDYILKPDVPFQCDMFFNLDGVYEAEFNIHIIDSYAKATGVELKSKKPKSVLSMEDFKRINTLIPKSVSPLLVVDFSDTWKGKEWVSDRYIDLLYRIKKKRKLPVVAIGKAQNRRIPSTVVDFNLLNDLSIPETVALICRSSCFIGTEGLTAHIAQSVSTPSVIMYGCTDPKFVSYNSHDAMTQRVVTPVECRGCRHVSKPSGNTIICPRNYECMKQITVDQVFMAFERLMKKYGNMNKSIRFDKVP